MGISISQQTTRLTTNKQAHERKEILFKLLGVVSPVEKIDPGTERLVPLVDAEIGDEKECATHRESRRTTPRKGFCG